MTSGDESKWKKLPSDVSNKDLVLSLLAAQPHYFYTTSSIPNNYFFSQLLRNFVENRNQIDVKNRSNLIKKMPTKTVTSKLSHAKKTGRKKSEKISVYHQMIDLNENQKSDNRMLKGFANNSYFDQKYNNSSVINQFETISTPFLRTPLWNPLIQQQSDFNCGFSSSLIDYNNFHSEKSAFHVPYKKAAIYSNTPKQLKKFDIASMIGLNASEFQNKSNIRSVNYILSNLKVIYDNVFAKSTTNDIDEENDEKINIEN